jgi:hypothetical protein
MNFKMPFRSKIKQKNVNILLAIITPLLFILGVLCVVLTSNRYGEFSVFNNSDEDLSKVTLVVGNQSFVVNGLKRSGQKKIRFAIGPDASLAIIAITESGKLIEAQNLVYVSASTNTSATIRIYSTSIKTLDVKSSLW